MTEGSDALSRRKSDAGRDPTHTRALRVEKYAVVGREPDSVRVVDRKIEPMRSGVDPFLHTRRTQQQGAFGSDGDDWKTVRGKSNEVDGRSVPVNPDGLGAGGKIELDQGVGSRSDLGAGELAQPGFAVTHRSNNLLAGDQPLRSALRVQQPQPDLSSLTAGRQVNACRRKVEDFRPKRMWCREDSLLTRAAIDDAHGLAWPSGDIRVLGPIGIDRRSVAWEPAPSRPVIEERGNAPYELWLLCGEPSKRARALIARDVPAGSVEKSPPGNAMNPPVMVPAWSIVPTGNRQDKVTATTGWELDWRLELAAVDESSAGDGLAAATRDALAVLAAGGAA